MPRPHIYRIPVPILTIPQWWCIHDSWIPRAFVLVGGCTMAREFRVDVQVVFSTAGSYAGRVVQLDRDAFWFGAWAQGLTPEAHPRVGFPPGYAHRALRDVFRDVWPSHMHHQTRAARLRAALRDGRLLAPGGAGRGGYGTALVQHLLLRALPATCATHAR